MTNINKHIEDYLDYYCSFQHSPEYAVLIKGSWGAGKTWLIKKYFNKLEENKQKYLYVSLYGVTTFEEIENTFFQQLHPLLASKGMAIAGKILKSALKTTIKIDLDEDSEKSVAVQSQVPSIKIPDYLKNTQNCILIFDDLERCDLNIENILGYINHFVEHQGLKVIIVANEAQIIKSELGKPETEISYKRIKEKLIGRTLEVVSDIDDALNAFISNIDDPSAKTFLEKNKFIIKEIYLSSHYENLRLLKQALWDFERLFKKLPDIAKDKEELLKHLLKLLLVFSFEIRQGEMQASSIGNILKSYFRLLSKEKENNKYVEIADKYKDLHLYDTVLTEKTWTDFLEKGIIDDEAIKESLLNSSYLKDVNRPDWAKLWHYYNLTDEEFETLLKQVYNNFKNKSYQDLGIIKHVVGLLLRFSESSLLNNKKAVILKQARQLINYLKRKKN